MSPGNEEKIELCFRGVLEEASGRHKRSEEVETPKIQIGMATCGIASGALETKKAFEEALAEQGINAIIRSVGCMGHCYAEPTVIIENPGFPPILYHQVTPGKARVQDSPDAPGFRPSPE